MSDQLQQNNNNFNMILKAAMNVPGVQVRRNEFLFKELSKYFPNNIIMDAIDKTPALAGITTEQIDKIAKSNINFETNKVTLISAVAGIPCGFAMIGTVPVVIAQYFSHIFRILQ